MGITSGSRKSKQNFRANVRTGPGRRDEDLTMEHTSASRVGESMIKSSVTAAYDRAVKNAEFAAQHGTVRILFKDGKPVE